MQVYREGDLALEQLTAFAITDDHARQEGVYERLSYNRDASAIRRMLTETHVAATDRRARFVGIEAYTEAGGSILRDLFTEDRGGYLEDVALLDLLVTAKLGREADAVRALALDREGSTQQTVRVIDCDIHPSMTARPRFIISRQAMDRAFDGLGQPFKTRVFGGPEPSTDVAGCGARRCSSR
ncbi:hypothetical protein ACVW1A_000005 [Bradyrhizobium sp. LB1.3]